MNKYNKPRIVYTPEERIIRRNLRNREKCRKSRENVLITLGGKCIKCGFNDFRALQIDHIKNDGFKERRKKLSIFDFNKNVMESYLRNENRYQILCANCNWIKRWLLSQNNLDESPDLTFKIKVSKNDNA